MARGMSRPPYRPTHQLTTGFVATASTPRTKSPSATGAGLRHIPVSAAHRHRKVLLLVAGANVRIVTTDGTLLRQLTLDPNRDYQPLGGRWPVHNVMRQRQLCPER